MNAYKIFGIEPSQVYASADGSGGRLIVRDVLTHADIGDVIVFDETTQEERRIHAFKLAKVRYYLVDFKDGDERDTLLQALRSGQATPLQQFRIAQLFKAMESSLEELKPIARRGRFVVEDGEWHRRDSPQDGKRTWLAVRVAPDADLSCIGTRGSELDKAIKASEM